MDYNARMYSPTLGRFIQPDTIVPDMFNPQSLNRYSYVLNNPIRYTDPTGHCPGLKPGIKCAANPQLTLSSLKGNNASSLGSANGGFGSNNPLPTSTPNPFAVVVPSGIATPEFQGTPVPDLTQTEYFSVQGRSYWVFGEFGPLTDENSIEIIVMAENPFEVGTGVVVNFMDPIDDAFPGLEEKLSNLSLKFTSQTKANIKFQETHLMVEITQYNSSYIPQTSYAYVNTTTDIVSINFLTKSNVPFTDFDFYNFWSNPYNPNSLWEPIP